MFSPTVAKKSDLNIISELPKCKKKQQPKNKAQTHNIKRVNFNWKFKLTVEDVIMLQDLALYHKLT